jgi:hypothetical protein
MAAASGHAAISGLKLQPIKQMEANPLTLERR